MASSVVDALTDPRHFAGWLGDSAPWAAWIALLKGAFAEPMSDAERATFRRLTDRDPPAAPVRELWVIAGRRSGKSTMAAALAVYGAALVEYPDLRPGEVATIPVIAQDRAAARTVFRYCRALLDAAGLLPLVARETADAIELTTGAAIEITTASGRAVRGYSMPLIVADECAHWRSDTSTEPDTEILEALRPGQATFRRPLLVAISSPHARRGALWQTFKDHYGKDGDVLVVRGATTDFNPTVPQTEVDRAVARDPAAAQSEWFGQFRTDVESFLSLEAVEAVTVPGRRELPYRAGLRYFAFADMSGGVGDAAALAVAHWEDGRAVLDLVREVPAPHSPEDATREFAETLKAYRLSEVTSDRYAAQWAVDRFREHGVKLSHSDKSRSEIYLELLPAVNSGQVALLDHQKLRVQLTSLERRTSRACRDSVDHPPHGSDDLANAVAGALTLKRKSTRIHIGLV